ncbi:hypothetical protein Ccrd_006690 [Cynara cardunculus var. scolymus]|uniref:Uncharacterized protein n=1 Tax=Cynara cardunculus var. scolymus TaxID=59895 RepID=A0A103XIA5_CYNCS|nr:hypothetical protein Ccrd_006690 [Cynara cardunculus var. scolymus]
MSEAIGYDCKTLTGAIRLATTLDHNGSSIEDDQTVVHDSKQTLNENELESFGKDGFQKLILKMRKGF